MQILSIQPHFLTSKGVFETPLVNASVHYKKAKGPRFWGPEAFIHLRKTLFGAQISRFPCCVFGICHETQQAVVTLYRVYQNV